MCQSMATAEQSCHGLRADPSDFFFWFFFLVRRWGEIVWEEPRMRAEGMTWGVKKDVAIATAGLGGGSHRVLWVGVLAAIVTHFLFAHPQY